MKHYIVGHTTLATFTIVEENEQIIGIQFGNQAISEESTPLLLEAKKQIEEYIDGKRNTFSLPYHYQGSPFQNQVWKVIESIPYGQTLTYQEIAKKMGKPKAYRAVGNALNKNPLPIELSQLQHLSGAIHKNKNNERIYRIITESKNNRDLYSIRGMLETRTPAINIDNTKNKLEIPRGMYKAHKDGYLNDFSLFKESDYNMNDLPTREAVEDMLKIKN